MDFLSADHELLALERKLWDEGFSFVAGVDEAGRGPLAGPVVAAAVIFPPGAAIPAVDDSKKLSEARRNELREAILAVSGVKYAIAEVSAEKIDEINILRASHLAMKLALEQLGRIDFILVDGLPVPGLPAASEAVVKGDGKSASIAAASILAKVHRDALMAGLAAEYPLYGFEKHKGYGTEEHLRAIAEHGVCAIHRRSFAPVRDTLSPPPEQLKLNFL